MTFKDLVFKPHPNMSCLDDANAKQAVVHFANGYSASVISGYDFYTSDDEPYELAVLKNGRLCYDTPITDDVVGHLTEDGVTDLLQRIEAL